MVHKFTSFFGVDFSGAKQAGKNIWIARLESNPDTFQLTDLHCLAKLCSPERYAAHKYLVDRISESESALWGMDLPFGLPLEIMGEKTPWSGQIKQVQSWGDDAYDFGLECIRRAKLLGGPIHVRRLTDTEAKAPFDGYHYRIIYQTFYGMRDVVGQLMQRPHTAIIPFHYTRLAKAKRVCVETCPSSTLKRLGLPHQNYKQPTGGPLLPKRLKTRHAILDGLAEFVLISPGHRRVIMRNGGGDALDAVIAALGAIQGWRAADHAAIRRHSRYPREGYIFS